MENSKRKIITTIIFNIVLVILVSLFMYNAYKCISGFVANNADDGMFMMTLITSYCLPVIAYLIFFYKSLVKPFNKVGNIISSLILIAWGIFNLVNIFMNIDAYMTNNALGVYESLNPLLVYFPYDMIVVSFVVITLQILNILMIRVKNQTLTNMVETVKHYGYFKFNIFEYLFICIVAILSFVFIGDFFISFKSIQNVVYDPKFIYLMLWVLIVPSLTLLSLVFKVENKDISLLKKNIYMGSIIGINVLFIALLFILEAVTPNFIVYCGKPFFAITFSVSIPIEILILLGYGALTALYFLVKLIVINVKAQKVKGIQNIEN